MGRQLEMKPSAGEGLVAKGVEALKRHRRPRWQESWRWAVCHLGRRGRPERRRRLRPREARQTLLTLLLEKGETRRHDRRIDVLSDEIGRIDVVAVAAAIVERRDLGVLRLLRGGKLFGRECLTPLLDFGGVLADLRRGRQRERISLDAVLPAKRAGRTSHMPEQ